MYLQVNLHLHGVACQTIDKTYTNIDMNKTGNLHF